MTLQLVLSEFPYILFEENFILFFLSVAGAVDIGDK
jgi:hypothetical protein